MPADPQQQDYTPFRVDVHPERDVVRVVPVGELDLATAPLLEAQLHELRRSGFDRVLLDLRELNFVDSAGIRVIVTEHHFASDNNREFSLVGGRPAVVRALAVSGLLDRLHVEQG